MDPKLNVGDRVLHPDVPGREGVVDSVGEAYASVKFEHLDAFGRVIHHTFGFLRLSSLRRVPDPAVDPDPSAPPAS